MSKLKARPMYGVPRASGGGGSGGGGGGNMMAQLQKLQDEMAKTQEKLHDGMVEVTVGGGMIKAVMTGHQKLVSIAIAPEAVDPDDVEMLQDMIVAAVNEAVERSQALASERMGALTGGLGGLGIPGLM
jgi:DNA-binding YbaB/EbfC family protein